MWAEIRRGEGAGAHTTRAKSECQVGVVTEIKEALFYTSVWRRLWRSGPAVPFPCQLNQHRESLGSLSCGGQEVSWLLSTPCPPPGRGVYQGLTHPALSGVSLEKEEEKHFKEFCLKERKETVFRNKRKLYGLFKNSIYLKNTKSRKIILPHESSGDTDFTFFPIKSCQFYHHQFSLLWLILSAGKKYILFL